VRRHLLVFPVLVALLGLGAGCSTPAGDRAGDRAGDPDGLGKPVPARQPTTRTADPSDVGSASPGGSARPGTPHVVRTVATGLAVPWGVTFLPDGTALVGERDTTRVVAIKHGTVRTVGRVAGVTPTGEAGLLGLATSPSYASDRLVYAYLSTAKDNRVVTMSYDGRHLGQPKPILTRIPHGFVHDGGRLLFAKDGTLFVSTGETGEGTLAQDPDSLGGKILRITRTGRPAPQDPVKGSPVWTMGHRNVQGLAFDSTGRLWATEFGKDTWDELNRIDRARNYGWPLVEGRGDLQEYRNPYVQWRTRDASPSGLAYLDGSLWAGALRGGRLWQIPLQHGVPGTPRDFFVGSYGRLRTVVAAPDGNLWVTTSNRDGRGEVRPGDDRILVVAPR
jgi:glucose/arabinose dehydrogenase